MTYYADLTLHMYTKGEVEDRVFNAGWLGKEYGFTTGEISAEFVRKLGDLCSQPINLHRGFHTCEFCGNAKGNGQIRVYDPDGNCYCAPTMVHHYVVEHRYRPLDAFIEAVLKTAQESRE